jgi:hypothetical protein
MGSSAACSACHRRMPKPLRRSANSCALSTASGATGRPICPQGGALPGGAAGLNRRTSSSAMCASSVQGLGGTVINANQMLALRCGKYHGTFDRVFERYGNESKTGQGKRLLKNGECSASLMVSSGKALFAQAGDEAYPPTTLNALRRSDTLGSKFITGGGTAFPMPCQGQEGMLPTDGHAGIRPPFQGHTRLMPGWASRPYRRVGGPWPGTSRIGTGMTGLLR